MRPWKAALYLALLLSGCGVTGHGPAPATTSYVGWYLEHGGQGRLQLCGQPHALRVAASTVQQFGSPTPIRNCGMTGVVLPAAPPRQK